MPTVAVVASEGGQTAAARVSESSYRHFLDDTLYTHTGDNRGFGTEHDLAQANIFDLFVSFGLDVTLEPVLYQGNTYWNVVGTKAGTVTPDEEWIVGAHYDSVDNPGADDNASGVALVLEAARILSVYPSEDTIRFIAFDREEQGLHGSQAYAADHIDDNILGMISADMVAYNTGAESVDIEGRSSSEPIKSELGAAVVEYGQGLSYAIHGAADYSDHAPFEWAGFRACLIIEDWGNPYYHTQMDTVDSPNYIDYAFATRVARSIVGFLVDHAGVEVGDCGNGAVEPGETCDVGIAAGQPGACPMSCENTDPCIVVTLIEPGTCLAECESVEVADPIHGDGCCPPGANSLNDDDCDPFCGNAVCEAGEEVDCIADCTCVEDADCNDFYVCTNDTCESGVCAYTPGIYDYGDVTHDTVTNLFDVFCVLEAIGGDYRNCTLLDVDIHPCSGDGAANLFDAFAVLDAIGGIDACCSGGAPAPATMRMPPEVYAAVNEPWLSLVPSKMTIEPGELVTVDMVAGNVPALGAYALSIEVTAGRGGQLELLETADSARVLKRDAKGRTHLGTYTFRASVDAEGPFLLTVPRGTEMLTDAAGNKIELRLPPTALITVR
jgi:hypothetical protein